VKHDVGNGRDEYLLPENWGKNRCKNQCPGRTQEKPQERRIKKLESQLTAEAVLRSADSGKVGNLIVIFMRQCVFDDPAPRPWLIFATHSID
jgi:hypothetical protein